MQKGDFKVGIFRFFSIIFGGKKIVRSDDEKEWINDIMRNNKGKKINNDELEALLILYAVDARAQVMHRRFTGELLDVQNMKKKLELLHSQGQLHYENNNEIEFQMVEHDRMIKEADMHLVNASVDKTKYSHLVLSKLHSVLKQMLKDEKYLKITQLVSKELLSNFTSNIREISDEVLKALERLYDEVIEAHYGYLDHNKSSKALRKQFEIEKDLINTPAQKRREEKELEERYGRKKVDTGVRITHDDEVVKPETVSKRNLI